MIRQSKRLLNGREQILKKHLYPEPRLALGRWLAEKHLASAMMDLSDGLSTDLPRLCAASGVGAHIRADKIPSVRTRGRQGIVAGNLLDLALHGGEDYELLFTVPIRKLEKLPGSFQGIPLTAIGEITMGRRLMLVEAAGQVVLLPDLGWDPFRRRR
jgi:thiamine-monophosphate kinase